MEQRLIGTRAQGSSCKGETGPAASGRNDEDLEVDCPRTVHGHLDTCFPSALSWRFERLKILRTDPFDTLRTDPFDTLRTDPFDTFLTDG